PEPRAVQLIGTEPDELAEAAIWQVSQGAQIIDLNMGCPAKKVCSVAAGSALMGDPERVSAIFDALVSAVNIPITVKMRTGLDSHHKNAVQMAEMAQHHGLQAVTIHGRTRADKFQGCAEYDTIKAVKQAIDLPIIANGDICTPKQAQFVLKYTTADAIMIGRATQGYPWIFREVNHYLKTGEKLPPPALNEMYETIHQHISGVHQLYGEVLGPRIARKHIGWYGQHLPHGEQLRKSFNHLSEPSAQIDLINHYFDALGIVTPK
ncbi:MAG: tRNA dihydrouridine synthase DusB, partial [Gammaproteobacteria bacterium]|nr:tRNA dihydrouridine synthase DusB [Gammaproteobacteria bacterium]